MKRIPALSTIFTSLVLALPAGAQTVPDGCYARTYSTNHLVAHPAQVVDWITAYFAADTGGPNTGLWLRVGMADQGLAARDGVGGMTLTQSLSNFQQPTVFQVDGDGGSLRITAADASGITLQTGGVFLSEGGDFFEEPSSTLSEGGNAPTVYRLYAADPSVCGY